MSNKSFENIFSELNEMQREAVLYEGNLPVLVLAGPGSGKTHVITQRVRYLLEWQHAKPENILVMTFTRDAAQTMQKRYYAMNHSEKIVHYGTFHSVFYQILKQSIHLKDSQILKENEKKQVLMPLLGEFAKGYNAAQKGKLCKEILQAIGLLKNTRLPERALKGLPDDIRPSFFDIFHAYEKARKDMGKLDFDDMLCDCSEMLLNNRRLMEEWQHRFSHILIDEFQDINPAQYEIIKLLAPPPLPVFAVGDDDQAIYGFRGSDPDCMKRFVSDYSPKEVVLNINYRSRPEIVKKSLLMIGENSNRFAKQMRSAFEKSRDNNGGKEKEIRIEGFKSREEENAYLEKCCKKDEECVVLFRTNRLMNRFAMGLKSKNIKFAMREKLQDPYEDETIKDFMAYLRLANGQENYTHWARVINKPCRYVSREAMAICWEQKEKTDMLQGLKEYYQQRDMRIHERIVMLSKQLKALQKLSPFTAMQYIRKVIGYENYLLEEFKGSVEERDEAIETMNWLARNAEDFHDLQDWFQFQENCKRMEESGDARVKLMTVHASKGLEFETVYIPYCNERIYPYGHMLAPQETEEERRIFYVGMTRAKASLILTYSRGTKAYPEEPSRFLKKLMK